jgi:CubicO group peptidase (beta-lactamase class C family)
MGEGMTLRAKTLIVFVLMLVLLSVPQLSATVQPVATQQAPNMQAIDAYLESQLGQYLIPGLALAIVKGDQIVHLKGFGIADPEKHSVTPDTPFILGSVSKSFTALAIMQLVDAGKVNLDNPVQKYLPSFSVADHQAASQITVRQLLNQISGISTHTGREQFNDNDTSDGALEKDVRHLKTVRLSQPVGKKFQYSNTNYTILGAIAVGLLIGLPVIFDTPLPVMLFFQPDLIGLGILCATLALVGGLLRTLFSIRALLKKFR